MTQAESRERSATMRRLLETPGPHALVCLILSEPSGARRMELRRLVDGRPLLMRCHYSAALHNECLAEGVEVEVRAVVRLPAWGSP